MMGIGNLELGVGNDALSRLASRDSAFPIPNSPFASNEEAP